MDAWQILAWAAGCGAGALAFLAVVAQDLRRVTVELKLLEKLEKRKLEHCQEEADALAVIKEVEVAE